PEPGMNGRAGKTASCAKPVGALSRWRFPPILDAMRFSALPRLIAGFFLAALFLCLLHPAWAAEAAAGNGATGSGRAEALLIAEVMALMVVGRLLGEGLQRIGQPALIGQLLAGLI